MYVILSANEISHRTIDLPNKLSLRGSIATAAISREGEYCALLSPIVLLRYACNPLPTKEEARMYVILSGSEISHRKCTEHILFT